MKESYCKQKLHAMSESCQSNCIFERYSPFYIQSVQFLLMNFEKLDVVVLLALFVHSFYYISLLSVIFFAMLSCLVDTVNTSKIFNNLKFDFI